VLLQARTGEHPSERAAHSVLNPLRSSGARGCVHTSRESGTLLASNQTYLYYEVLS
jgi:hypothetical protein